MKTQTNTENMNIQSSRTAPTAKTAAGQFLVSRAKERGIPLSRLSAIIERNETYLQQFVTRGTPAELDLDDRHKLATILGCSLNDLTNDKRANRLLKGAATQLHMAPYDLLAQSGLVVIMGKTHGRFIDFNSKEQSRGMSTPKMLLGVEGAYATRMPDNSMEPAFSKGELVFVNPAREARPGDDVVLRYKDGRGLIRHFLAREEKWVMMKHYQPKLDAVSVDLDEIASMHVIVAATRCTQEDSSD